MFRYWLIAFLTAGLCISSVVWVLEKQVTPRMLRNANEEIVADWRDAILQRHQETGTWPRTGTIAEFAEDIFIVRGADDRRIVGGYMHGKASYSREGVPCDAYGTPLKFDFSADRCQVASAGPDRAFGTSDDLTSDSARARYSPSSLEDARTQAAARARRRADPPTER